MTDDSNEIEDVDNVDAGNEASENVTFDQPEGTDWHLASIVDLAAALGVEIDVTLYLSGIIVTGTVIGPKRYFELTEEVLKRANTSGSAENLAESIASLLSRYKDLFPAAGQEGAKLGTATYRYIHLRDVRIFRNDGGFINITEGAWRAKMSAVDGFNFGRMTMD